MAGGKKFNLKELLNQRSEEEWEGADTLDKELLSGKEGEEKEAVIMVDVYDLEPSKENFYKVDDSLKHSIELVGILQPLLVKKPENGRYKVIAGHRRRLAVLSLVKEGKEERRYVPCVFKKEDVRDRLAILMANRFRDKTDWERMMEAVEAEGLAKELKKDYKLGGRTREVLSEITGLSETQLGRYKAVFKNLNETLMEEFREDRIGFSVVSELCGLPQEWQEEAGRLLRVSGLLSLQDIKELKRRKEEQEQKKIKVSSDRESRKEERVLEEETVDRDAAVRRKSDSQSQYNGEKEEGEMDPKNEHISKMPEIDKEAPPCNMKVVNITMEKRLHIAMQALVTEMEFEQVKSGESPLLERLKRELDSGDGYVEYDYSVADEKGNSIIDWN